MSLKKTKKSTKTKEKKILIIKNILDSVLNNKYQIKKDKINLLNSKNMGKSGAKIGTYTYQDSEKIIKFIKLPKEDIIKIKNEECINLHFFYNELFINHILQNISKFITPKQYLEYKQKNYQNNLVKTIKCGRDDKIVFSINEKIGIKNKKVIYRNWRDIFVNNYIPYFIENQDNSEELLYFIIEKLDFYIDMLRFYHRVLKFNHTDLKLENVFVKKANNQNTKPFINQYDILLSDLDKSNLKINKTTIMPINSNTIVTKIYKLKYIYNMRYKCSNNTKCKNFTPIDIDIMTLIYDIYILFFKALKNNLNLFYTKLEVLHNYVKKKLNMNDEAFTIMIKELDTFLIKNFKKHKISVHINVLIYNFCTKLNRLTK